MGHICPTEHSGVKVFFQLGQFYNLLILCVRVKFWRHEGGGGESHNLN